MESRKERPDDCENLKTGGHFAGKPGPNRGRVICQGEDPETQGNDDVTAHHDYRQPTGDDVENSQGDEGRGEQQFIGDGIQKSAQLRPLMPDPGEKTIEAVSYPRDDEHYESVLIGFRYQEDDKQRNEEHSRKGQCVGKVHGLGLSFLSQHKHVTGIRAFPIRADQPLTKVFLAPIQWLKGGELIDEGQV